MRRLLACLLLPFAATPALACSDLPNICEQQAAAWQLNEDMAREAADAYYAEQEEEAYVEEYDYNYDYSAGNPPMQARLDSALAMLQLVTSSADEMERLTADPRYQRYVDGGWDFFQDEATAAPGEYCAALYWKGDTLVRLSGPGGDYAGALLTFWSPDIPAPGNVQTVPVTLIQSDGAQTVQAFNYQTPGEAMAAVALAIPSLDAALATMEDTQPFEVQMDGRTVAKIEWTGGFAAREQLRACAARR